MIEDYLWMVTSIIVFVFMLFVPRSIGESNIWIKLFISFISSVVILVVAISIAVFMHKVLG